MPTARRYGLSFFRAPQPVVEFPVLIDPRPDLLTFPYQLLFNAFISDVFSSIGATSQDSCGSTADFHMLIHESSFDSDFVNFRQG